jgi:hypothetical protein
VILSLYFVVEFNDQPLDRMMNNENDFIAVTLHAHQVYLKSDFKSDMLYHETPFYVIYSWCRMILID